jgi:hypothetical protein
MPVSQVSDNWDLAHLLSVVNSSQGGLGGPVYLKGFSGLIYTGYFN